MAAKKSAWDRFDKEKRDFLLVLTTEGFIKKACEHLKKPYEYIRKLRRDDPDFDAACEDAQQVRKLSYADGLESRAMRLARDGWLEPVFQMGKRVGVKRAFSPTLTMFMLKAHRPDTYQFAEKAIATTPEAIAREVKEALDKIKKNSGVGLRKKRRYDKNTQRRNKATKEPE